MQTPFRSYVRTLRFVPSRCGTPFRFVSSQPRCVVRRDATEVRRSVGNSRSLVGNDRFFVVTRRRRVVVAVCVATEVLG